MSTRCNIAFFRTFVWSSIVAFGLVGLAHPAAAVETVTIVSPRGSLPSVVTTGHKEEKFAAKDLCDYLSRVTGRKIAVSAKPAAKGVIIHVGRDAFVETNAPEIAKVFADGFLLKYVQSGGRDHVVVAGRIPRGTRWAAEEFLEQFCGVRWLFPDRVYGEVVPSRATIATKSTLSQTHESDYISRGHGAMYYFEPGRRYLRGRAYGAGYGAHAIQHMFTKTEFKAHPEWFAYFAAPDSDLRRFRPKSVGDRRPQRWHWDYGNGWQICTTNPGTVKHAVKYVLEYFKKNPDTIVCSVGPNDGSGWCQCPQCVKFVNSFSRPYTISERWFHWVNQVAKEVAKTHPDKWIETLAYGHTSAPTRFQLEPNVAVTVTIYAVHHVGLAEAWQKVCKSVNLYSYMYGSSFLGFRHYPRAARDLLKWGRDKLGARAHVIECSGDWTFDGPKYYYVQALQWDVNADPDKLMSEFCEVSYGKAVGSMRKFWDRLEQIYERRDPKKRFVFYHMVNWNTSAAPNDEFTHYTLADVEFLDKRIAEATHMAAADSEQVRFRVERMVDAWRYFRTVLVSYLTYSKMPRDAEATSEDSRNAALKLAREIADVRADRRRYLDRMRAYRQINWRMCKPYYWALMAGLTIFSHERSLLDSLCTAVSEYTRKSAGLQAALDFWRKVPYSSSLHQAARTQIYMLSREKLPNLLVNGDFETGDMTGWEASGHRVDVVGTQVHGGKYAARTRGGGYGADVSQKVSVSPGQRYRLTVWGRYLSETSGKVVPAEAAIQFLSGAGRGISVEPTRSTAQAVDPSAGWVALRSTVTVPPGATSAVIRLTKTRSPGKTLLWDDVAFERILDGPKAGEETLSDTFSSSHLDTDKWFQATSSGGFKLPGVSDGWLIYDDKYMYGLTSYATFNDLIKYTGEDRYRLRLHVAALPGRAEPTSLSWGIKTGTGVVNIADSGMFWTYHFPVKQHPKGLLRTYSYEHGAWLSGGVYPPKQLDGKHKEIWFTMYFDPKYVTVYAAAGGYDESDKAQVAKYEHKIKNITDKGSIYLKLSNGYYMLDEISLTSPQKVATE